jgi:hypothetical protein
MLTAIKSWFCAMMLLLLCQTAAVAQQAFIHIQTEGVLSFNANIDGKEFQSNRTGYLIIPEIPAGKYDMVISFPPGTWPACSFPLVIGDQPRAFSLKQGIDNSWTLFDMISFNVTAGVDPPKVPQAVMPPRVQVEAEPVNALPAESQRIRKIFDKASASGIDQVYIVTNGNRQDTVALFIPVLEAPEPKQIAQAVSRMKDVSAVWAALFPVEGEMLPRQRFAISHKH